MAENLLPEGRELPSGAALVEQGLALGAGIDAGCSAFCSTRGVSSEVEFKRARIAAGELQWSMIMGLASLEEQIEGLEFLHRFGEETGVVMDRGLIIPNWVTGLPERLRERAPKGTSFVLGGVEDHVRIAQAAPIMPCFNDFHIGSPAAVPNTLAAIQAGGSYMGVLAQYIWTLPYMDSDVESVAENVKAIAIVAQKWSDGVVVDSYLDDGMPAEFADNVSMIGYACLERYVVEELCGARYASGFGQLISDIPTKLAIWLALAEVLKSDHPPLSYLYGNTIDASETVITGNYGISAAEIVAFAVTERRYRTGVAFLPNPITERLQVPTVQEIADIHAAARMAAAKSIDIDELIDFSVVERIGTCWWSREPCSSGTLSAGSPRSASMFETRCRCCSACAGSAPSGWNSFAIPVDAIRRRRTESSRSVRLSSRSDPRRSSTPRSPTSAPRGSAIWFVAAASSSARPTPTSTANSSWPACCARWAGTCSMPVSIVTQEHFAALLRGREDRPAVAISTHNGQCVSYTRRLMTLLEPEPDRGDVFIGGKINTIADGESSHATPRRCCVKWVRYRARQIEHLVRALSR